MAKTCNYYFWRMYDQKEIELIEEAGGELAGFELKWKVKKMKPPGLFLTTYPNASYTLIHNQGYLVFIT